MKKPSISQYFTKFYTTEKAMKARFHRFARRMGFKAKTAAAARKWQRAARKRFAERLGMDRFERCTPTPKLMGRTTVNRDLVREHWRIRTEKDVWMTFYLFVPRVRNPERMPLALCLHGHSSAGKFSVSGRSDMKEMQPIIQKYNYDYGLQFARAGFIAVCPDARGFGERREPAMQGDRKNPDLFFKQSCHHLTMAGAPLGLTVMGMWAWDLMRLIDHLQRDRRIDGKRIVSAGLSGGGLQTLGAAPLDPRIRGSIVSGYFYGVREALQVDNQNCMCNMVPRLWEDFDMGDIAAMIAPRLLFIETGDRDHLNGKSGVANVRSQVRITQQAYDALGVSNNLRHHVFHGGHVWGGRESMTWVCEKMGVEHAAHG